jgi:hypothetical protein
LSRILAKIPPVNAGSAGRIVAMSGLLAALTTSACSVVGIRSGTAQPHFDVLDRVGQVEIRRYGNRVAAESTESGGEIASRDSGFRRLAGYIFGGNQGDRHIAMTAPVAALPEPDGRWTIRFFLPADLADPPRPRDPSIRIVALPAETMAVLRYSGARDAEAVAAKTRLLEQDITGTRWHPAGPPVAWFYDPPWTLPPLRRNEVAIPVSAVVGADVTKVP